MVKGLGITAPPIERGPRYAVGQLAAPELPTRAGALSEQMQDIARQYLGARQRSGQALLEAARWLSEARQAAKHGEWGIFLEATNTSDDTAERLLNIHAQAEQNPQFADFVRTQWIGQSAAALLAAPSTPPEVIAQVLSAPEPMKVAEIRSAIKEAKQPAESEIAPDFDAAHERARALGYKLSAWGGWWRLAGEDDLRRDAMPPADVLAQIAQLEAAAKRSAARPAAPGGWEWDASALRCLADGVIIQARMTDQATIAEAEAHDRARAQLAARAAVTDEPPAPAHTEPSTPDERSSAWHKRQQVTDDTALGAARISIERGNYQAAEMLLRQVQVKTLARDELQAQIPVAYAQPPIDPRMQAQALLRQLAPLIVQITADDQEGLSEAIDALYHAKAGSEATGWLRVGWALLDLEED